MCEEKLTTAQYRELATIAERELNWRLAIIYIRRAIDAYPQKKGQLARDDKEKLITRLNANKQTLRSYCPVCGSDMHETLCPDDVMRPYCEDCGKTFTPMGYDCEDDYAKKWFAITWTNGTQNGEVIEVS